MLSLNLVASMDDLPAVRPAAAQLAQAVEFQAGARYAEHKIFDKKAAFGLAGLVAAGAGLVVAKKVGVIALLLLFAKKGAVVLAAAGAALAARFRNRIGKKPKVQAAPALIKSLDELPSNSEDSPWRAEADKE